jgi:hypothetical protein
MLDADYRNESAEGGERWSICKGPEYVGFAGRGQARAFLKNRASNGTMGSFSPGIGIRFTAKHSPKAEIRCDYIFSSHQNRESSPTT